MGDCAIKEDCIAPKMCTCPMRAKKRSRRKLKRRAIEAGLLGSMAGMIGTGIAGHKKSHILTSALFTGLTVWHYMQYRSIGKRKLARSA